MEKNICPIVIWVAADGSYAVGRDEDEARDNWDNQCEGTPDEGIRVYHLDLRLAGPRAIAVTADIPESEGDKVYAVEVQ